MSGLRVAAKERLVFIGDSNTDTEHNTRFPPHGYGYVMFVATMISATHPELQLDIINRGVDGETVVDLARRWQQDVIDLQPDWLFVLIGSNDVTYRYVPDPDDRKVDDEAYARTLERLIEDTKARTAARIVLIEPMPFDLPPAVDDEPNHVIARLGRTIADIAARHGCGFVPVHERMAAVMRQGLTDGWYQNFNHPAFPGHAHIGVQVLRHLGWHL